MSTDKSEEYAAQFYEYTTYSVYRSLKEILDNVVSTVMESTQKKLVLKFKDESEEVKKALVELSKLYNESVEKHSKEMQPIVKKYFKIEDKVLLPGDEIQSTQYTQEQEEDLDNEIERLRTCLLALSEMENELEKACSSQYKTVFEHLSSANEAIEETIKSQSTLESSFKYINGILKENKNLNNVYSTVVEAAKSKTYL